MRDHVQELINYRAVFYKIEGHVEGTLHDITESISTVADKTIVIYYGSTVIDVVVPEIMAFKVTVKTVGTVASDKYKFINKSYLPIRVVIQELKVQADKTDGIYFVSRASRPGEIHLNLYGSRGFETNFQGIEPNVALNQRLGTLGGDLWGGTDHTGIIKVGGIYRGSVPSIPLRPQVNFIFSVELE